MVSNVIYSSKGSGYKLVWNDEFGGEALDTNKWSLTYGMSQTAELSMNEDESVCSVGGGELQLSAINRTDDSGHIYATTKTLSTVNSMSFKYGYLEMRARVPFEKGAWPSLWLGARDSLNNTSNLSYSNEVDVFEVFGSKSQLSTTVHKWYNDENGNNSGINAQLSTGMYTFVNAATLSNEYHIYGFKWTPDEMSFYVDGVKYATLDLSSNFDRDGYETDMSAFIDNPLHIKINNHLLTEGKNLGLENVDASDLPFEYDIDYIRLYQDDSGVINKK